MNDVEASIGAIIFSLATSAAVHFGDVPDSLSGEQQPPNLQAAKHMIDLLAVLEDKTRGNLTPEEAQLLKQVLYELRLRFVQAATNEAKPQIIP
jgi:hypothetical protein